MRRIWISILAAILLTPFVAQAQTQPFTGYLYGRGFSSYLGALSTQDFMRGYLDGVLKFSVDKDGELVCETAHIGGIPLRGAGTTLSLSSGPGSLYDLTADTITATDMYIGAGAARWFWDPGDSELVQTKATRFEDNLTANGNITLGSAGKWYAFYGTLDHDMTVGAGKTIDGVDISTLPASIAAKAGKPGRVVTVGQSGCDYTSIVSALASITDAASDKRYTVLVYPGTYQEDVTGKAYVDIVGADRQHSRIVHQASPTIQTVILPENSSISNITVTTAVPAENLRVINITGDNVIVQDCDLLGGNWGVTATAGSDNCIITRNYFTSANPVYPVSNVDGWYVAENRGSFSGTTTSCLAFCDSAFATNSIIANNSFTAVSVGGSAYGLSAGRGGNIVANNSYKITCGASTAYGITIGGGIDGAVNYIAGNTIEMVCTAASPTVLAAIATGTIASVNVPDTRLQGNSISLRSTNTPSLGVYSFYTEDANPEDEWTYPLVADATVYTDRASVSVGEGATFDPKHRPIVWLDEPFAASTLDDPDGADSTSITDSLGSVIDLSSSLPVFLRVGGVGDMIPISPARNLRVVGDNPSASGTLTIVGHDTFGGRIEEDFVVNGTTPVDGELLFSNTHYCYMKATGGAGKTATIGVGETVGYPTLAETKASAENPTIIGTVTADALVFGTTDVETALGGKSDTGHTHDDRYYTETESNGLLDAKLALAGGTMTGALTVSRAVGSAAGDGVVLSNPTEDWGQWSPQLRFASKHYTTAIQGTIGLEGGSSMYGTFLSMKLKYGAGADTEVWRMRADGLLFSDLKQTANTAATRIMKYELSPQDVASAGTPVRYSPSFRMLSQAWKSDATAASQANSWDITAMPKAGTARTYPWLTFTSGTNTGTPNTDRVSFSEDSIRIHTSKTPASTSADGYTGEMCWDSGYVYVCVSGDGPGGATDSWKRAALSTW